jgi:hypothetical protein
MVILSDEKPKETAEEDEPKELVLSFMSDLVTVGRYGSFPACATRRICQLNKYAVTAGLPQSTMIPLVRYSTTYKLYTE